MHMKTNEQGTKATKQRCDDCNRPTTHTKRTANGSYIYRCNRCQTSRKAR
jgi:hypothetical protein